jgi:hypothetical protein
MLGTVPMVKRCKARRGHADVALKARSIVSTPIFRTDGAAISQPGSHHCHIEILK